MKQKEMKLDIKLGLIIIVKEVLNKVKVVKYQKMKLINEIEDMMNGLKDIPETKWLLIINL